MLHRIVTTHWYTHKNNVVHSVITPFTPSTHSNNVVHIAIIWFTLLPQSFINSFLLFKGKIFIPIPGLRFSEWKLIFFFCATTPCPMTTTSCILWMEFLTNALFKVTWTPTVTHVLRLCLLILTALSLNALSFALLFILMYFYLLHANARLICIENLVIKCLNIGFTLKVLLFALLVI